MSRDDKEPSEAAKILAEFLTREIGSVSVRSWSAQHNLNADWVARSRRGKHEAQLDSLQELADKLKLEAWQLLYPGFDRALLAMRTTMSVEAIDAAKMIDSITDEGQRQRAYAMLSIFVEGIRGTP